MTEPVDLEPQALARLRDWGGEELLGKMVDLFLANTPHRMDQIREGITRSRPELVERGAHSLKSTALNLGAQSLGEMAARFEDRAVAGESGALEDRLPELEETYEMARRAIEALRNDGGDSP